MPRSITESDGRFLLQSEEMDGVQTKLNGLEEDAQAHKEQSSAAVLNFEECINI